MPTPSKKNRKRLNFTMDIHLLKDLEALVPSGQRSNFVNEALEEGLRRLSIQKANEATESLRKKLKLKTGSDEKLLKEIRYGRKEW